MWTPSRTQWAPETLILTPRQRVVQDVMNGNSSVYVYGPPGSGKTTLLDTVRASSPGTVRWHCSEFFRAVHDGLPGHDRDLDATVKTLTGRTGAVFFDEFHLHDVADAIYLRRALRWWGSHRVRVVATSNYPPEELLPNPLLHHAAEPVIAHIRTTFDVIDLDEGIDHRDAAITDRDGFASGRWLRVVPHDPATARHTLNARQLLVLPRSDGSRTIETTFAALCEHPWSTNDYLALVADLNSIVIHNVPHPARIDREPGQRLANLVDVAYDRDVPFTIHSPGAPDDLHSSVFPPLDVDRTVSRLRCLRNTPS